VLLLFLLHMMLTFLPIVTEINQNNFLLLYVITRKLLLISISLYLLWFCCCKIHYCCHTSMFLQLMSCFSTDEVCYLNFLAILFVLVGSYDTSYYNEWEGCCLKRYLLLDCHESSTSATSTRQAIGQQVSLLDYFIATWGYCCLGFVLQPSRK